MIEIRKQVYDMEYEISNKMGIRSMDRTMKLKDRYLRVRGKQLKTHKINSWYYKINLIDKEHKRHPFLLHRLCYAVFHNKPYTWTYLVWHHDDVATNWLLDNLYICDQKQNIGDKIQAYKLLWMFRKGKIAII
jgi:hypothetical protein